MKKRRFLMISDIHWCHKEWGGVPTKERMEMLWKQVELEMQKDSVEAIFLLGDYSLDHWKWDEKGSYLTKGVSNTKDFVDFMIPKIKQLGVRLMMLAGNHEQYGEAKWQEITGFSRQDYLICEDCLFIALDTYKTNLDPTEHSDGTYTNVDVGYIQMLMKQYPRHKVVLLSHYFDTERESQEFQSLVRNEDRILCLCCGHVHKSDVVQLGKEWGNKALLYTGQYSYPLGQEEKGWGIRDLTIFENGFISNYLQFEAGVCDSYEKQFDSKGGFYE